MKNSVLLISAASIGGYIASLYGGWSLALTTLCLFMAGDWLSGFIVAGIFHKSPKSSDGKLESRAGLKGLCRKGAIMLVVLVACRLDMLMGSETMAISRGVITVFIINEALSIKENVALMGVKVPKALSGAIEVLKSKVLKEGDTNDDSGENH